MKVLQPNCRAQFAAEDIEFILSVLGRKMGTAKCLVELLSDEDARDQILDDEALFHALLERSGCLRVSTRFYFYILIRRVFRRSDIEGRDVADYVAEILAEFARTERSRYLVPGQRTALEYFFELLAALQAADERTAFCLSVYIANYALFLSGIFPARVRFRSQARGSPDLRYYEQLGRIQYRAASDHRLAERYRLAPILGTLAERFGATRLALNDIADRLFSLGDTDYSIEALIRQQQESPQS